MRYFPVFLDLKQKSCLVVGAGNVGLRKAKTLLDCETGDLLLIDPHPPSRDLEQLLQNPCCRFEQREFVPQDLENRFLVLACTSDKELNLSISQLCKKKNILCNVADQPEEGDFVLPALYRQGELILAISTGGHSPALSRKIRQRLESCFGPEYKLLTSLLGRLRPHILEASHNPSTNKDIFRSLVEEPILEAIRNRDLDGLKELLQQRLPHKLHPKLGAICDDLFFTF